MRITIVGATGGVGKLLVEQAVAAGHDVTAVVRRPDRVPADIRRVEVDFSADESSVATVLKETVVGADAVLSALGSTASSDPNLSSRATRIIISAMQATDTRRLVLISSARVATSSGSSTAERFNSGLLRRIMDPLAQRALGAQCRDLAQLEDAVQSSGLVWTIMQPARLINRAVTGQYRTSIAGPVPRSRPVSRANLAHFMLHSINQSDTIGKLIRIAD